MLITDYHLQKRGWVQPPRLLQSKPHMAKGILRVKQRFFYTDIRLAAVLRICPIFTAEGNVFCAWRRGGLGLMAPLKVWKRWNNFFARRKKKKKCIYSTLKADPTPTNSWLRGVTTRRCTLTPTPEDECITTRKGGRKWPAGTDTQETPSEPSPKLSHRYSTGGQWEWWNVGIRRV